MRRISSLYSSYVVWFVLLHLGPPHCDLQFLDSDEQSKENVFRPEEVQNTNPHTECRIKLNEYFFCYNLISESLSCHRKTVQFMPDSPSLPQETEGLTKLYNVKFHLFGTERAN